MTPKKSTTLSLLLLCALVVSMNALDIPTFENYMTMFNKDYSVT